ncbi:MAG: hypothetical protein ACLR5H_11570 [Oscillospiraceae bacterium]
MSTAQTIAAGLSRYDLQVTVRSLPYDEYVQALEQGDFDLCLCQVKLTADWDLRPPAAKLCRHELRRLHRPRDGRPAGGPVRRRGRERSAAMTALCEKLLDQAPMVPVCFKSYSVLLPAGAASSPITPTASNPFYGISDWKLNMK